MATKIIDDTVLQDIAIAIQAKDHGGKMLDTQMAGRINDFPTMWEFDKEIILSEDVSEIIIDVENNYNYLFCVELNTNASSEWLCIGYVKKDGGIYKNINAYGAEGSNSHTPQFNYNFNYYSAMVYRKDKDYVSLFPSL